MSEDNCQGYYTEIIDNEKELDLSIYNPKKNLTIDELVELLNEQNETIIRLKNQVEYLDNSILTERSQIVKLQGKNEQLMKMLNNIVDYIQKDGG